jgi:uncharacterized protein YbjT (DUF2867 family)
MKVILFGATGMVGQGVLRECLRDPNVAEVVSVVRAPTGRTNPKLREIVHENFSDFSSLSVDGDACFWCLGVSVAGMSEADYTRITHDYTLAAAKVLARPTMTIIFVSAAGVEGNAMWARVKRRTEVELAELPFKALYIFRPGLIRPLHGIRSRTRLYNVLYPILSPLMLAIDLIRPQLITNTERVGRAMLHIAQHGYSKRLLGNSDINAAARGESST